MADAPLLETSLSHAAPLPYTLKADRFSSHARIARIIRRQTPPVTVLDIGCAYGFLRPYLPSPDYYLIGVDIHAEAVEQARASYDEAYQADAAADVALPLKRQPDVIVFGDVLEHLVDPAAALVGVLRRYAAPGTRIIVSLPNVAHLYTRLNLLVGRFDYAERGLLDRTHLRFFTLPTAKRLIEDSGLRLLAVDATPVPLHLVHPAFGEGQPLFVLHALSNGLAKLLKPLLAYQFILEALYADR